MNYIKGKTYEEFYGIEKTKLKKEKMSLANKGKYIWKNKSHPMLGKYHSEETKKLISQRTKEAMNKPEIRKKILEINKEIGIKHRGFRHTKESVKKMKQSKLGDLNPSKRLEVRQKMSQNHWSKTSSDRTTLNIYNIFRYVDP